MGGWQKVGGVEPTALSAARVSAHWATQTIAAAARALIPSHADDSHMNLAWNGEYRALVGNRMRSGKRLGLRLTDFAIVMFEGGEAAQAFQLDGRSLVEAYGLVGAMLGDNGNAVPLDLPDYDMPAHALRDGASFARPASESLNELARWFANADFALKSLARRDERATSVAVWPHHFDTGGIVYLGDAQESSAQIGFGLSPGDASFDQPYFYVTPWPLRDDAPAPVFETGRWNTAGFSGAVLTGSDVARVASGEAQYRLVEQFLNQAVRLGESMIAPSPR